jgi:UTP--glucose-1-phosphate uridylyltransferase
MLDVYEAYGEPVIGALKTTTEGTKKYGIIDPGKRIAKGVYEVKGVVEKPGPKKAPSRLAANAGYVLTPEIFTYIKKMKPGHSGEYILLDAISAMMKKKPVYAAEIEGEYFDTGSKIGWLHANLAFALEREDLAKDVKRMLKSIR